MSYSRWVCLLGLSGSLLLGACGQKGPLFLPNEGTDVAPQSPPEQVKDNKK